MSIEANTASGSAGSVSMDALIDRVGQLHREIAGLEAAQTRVMAQLSDLIGERIAALPSEQRSAQVPLRDAAARLGALTRQSDRTVQARLGDASAVVAFFPATVTAWERGEISRTHVRIIVDAGSRIDDPQARADYEDAILDVARHQTPARTRPLAARIAQQHDPVSLTERHRNAREQRTVRVYPRDDGMARLIYDGPAVLAHGIMDRLTQLADVDTTLLDVRASLRTLLTAADKGSLIERALAQHTVVLLAIHADAPDAFVPYPGGGDAAGNSGASTQRGHVKPGHDKSGQDERGREKREVDERTKDQRRADLFAQILLTGTPADSLSLFAGITANIQLVIPVLTLTEPDDRPGMPAAELVGHGLIDPDTARILTTEAPGWDRVFTDPVTATVREVDRYQPTQAQKRFLRARDVHCRFPGCARPARHCDIDHTHDAAKGGKTALCNLACLCQNHHVIKHNTAWTVEHRQGGALKWRDPAGREYLDKPPPVVGFIPDDYYPRARARARNGDLHLIDTTPAPF